MAWTLADLEKNLLIGSTLVEGSTLSEKQASQALRGKTLQGHPIAEIRELFNYRNAVEWLMKEVKVSPYLSEDLLKHFHHRLFLGFPGEHGKWKSAVNFTYLSDGSRHKYVSPPKVAAEIRKWIRDFNEAPSVKTREAASKKGAQLYYNFENIHPFDDGNGRVGRILMAYWFHWKANLSFCFFLRDKLAHLAALEAANRGDIIQLRDFFRKHLRKEGA